MRRRTIIGLATLGLLAAVSGALGRALCALRGHEWMEEKGRDPRTGLQIWRLRCAACGARTRGVTLKDMERRAA